jgi:D-alanyl-D-alanine carboxypeptidase
MTTTVRRPAGPIAVAILLALSACSGASGDPSSSPAASSVTTSTGAPTSALKTVDPVALQALVDRTIEDWLIPGAVVLVRTPQGDVTVGAGTAEIGRQQIPDANTHFRIASNTKTMTSAVILQLAQEGKLRLDDAVSTYVAGVPGGDTITVAQLLEMRTGLYNYTNSPIIADSLDNDPARAWQPQQLLDIALAQPINFAPGAEFEYSNTNYVLLGMIVEKVDGRSLADALQARLFGPLGMTNTALPAGADTTLPEPSAHGYQYGSSSVPLFGEPEYTPEQIAAAHDGSWAPTDVTGINHSFAFAAGGVVSTAGDLATWMDALVGGKVLNPEYQRLWAASPQVEHPDNPAGQWYGYGITRQKVGDITLTFHGGETAGYNSFMGVDAANDMTLVVWTNQPVTLDSLRQTANSLMVRVLDLIYVDPPSATAPTSSSPSSAQTAAFEQSACPAPNLPGLPTFDFPSTMTCGYLTVPENRSRPSGRTIKVFVARARRLGHTGHRSPGGAGRRARRGRVDNQRGDDPAWGERGTRRVISRPARHAALGPAADLPGVRHGRQRIGEHAVHLGRGHRARGGGGTGLPRPVGGGRDRPVRVQHRRERRRHRRSPGRPGYRPVGCLRRLLRQQTRRGAASRPPRGHPQRGARLGVAAEPPPRAELVVGARELGHGDLRRLRGAAGLRGRVPDPGDRFLRRRPPSHRLAGGRRDHRTGRRTAGAEHRRLRAGLCGDHGHRTARRLRRAEDDHRRRGRAVRRGGRGDRRVPDAGVDRRGGRARPGVRRVLLRVGRSHHRGGHSRPGQGGAAAVPRPGADDPAQAGPVV